MWKPSYTVRLSNWNVTNAFKNGYLLQRPNRHLCIFTRFQLRLLPLHPPEAADTDAGAALAAQPAAEEIPTERDSLQFRKTPWRGRHSQASLIWVGTFIKRNKKIKDRVSTSQVIKMALSMLLLGNIVLRYITWFTKSFWLTGTFQIWLFRSFLWQLINLKLCYALPFLSVFRSASKFGHKLVLPAVGSSVELK